MDIFFLIGLILVGLFIGIFSGMLGIGGGTILVPVFRLAFGMSPMMSTATSLFTIIPTSISGAISHFRQKTVHLPIGLILGLGGACASPAGVVLASISPAWLVMTVAAIIIGYSAINMFVKAIKMKSLKELVEEKTEEVETVTDRLAAEIAVEQKLTAEAVAESKKVKLTKKFVFLSIGIGLLAGLASGYVGVGGGFIMVPLMVSLMGFSMKTASGTSLVAIIILAIPGVIQQALMGNVDYLAGIIVAIGTIPGAVIGTHLLKLISERTLRFIFGGFLIVAAILLVLKELSLLG